MGKQKKTFAPKSKGVLSTSLYPNQPYSNQVITRQQFRSLSLLVFFTGFSNPMKAFLIFLIQINVYLFLRWIPLITYYVSVFTRTGFVASFLPDFVGHSLRFLVCVNNVFLFLTFWRSCDLVNLTRGLFCLSLKRIRVQFIGWDNTTPCGWFCECNESSIFEYLILAWCYFLI